MIDKRIINSIDKKITLNKKNISQLTYSEFGLILDAIKFQKQYLKIIFNSLENPNVQKTKTSNIPYAMKKVYVLSSLALLHKFSEEIIDLTIIGRYSIAYNLLRSLFEQWGVLLIIIKYNKLYDVEISLDHIYKKFSLNDEFKYKINNEPLVMLLWDYSRMNISPKIEDGIIIRPDFGINDKKYYLFLRNLFSFKQIKAIISNGDLKKEEILTYHYKLFSIHTHGVEFTRYSNDYQYIPQKGDFYFFYGSDFNNIHAFFILSKLYNIIDLIFTDINNSKIIDLPLGYKFNNSEIYKFISKYSLERNITLNKFKLNEIFV